ncbi:hypothetical protein [Microbacterium xylanilyticum]
MVRRKDDPADEQAKITSAAVAPLSDAIRDARQNARSYPWSSVHEILEAVHAARR